MYIIRRTYKAKIGEEGPGWRRSLRGVNERRDRPVHFPDRVAQSKRAWESLQGRI